MADSLVHFEFVGDASTEVEKVAISVPRTALEEGKFAETVLARLATTAWKKGSASGSQDRPLEVQPLESCPTSWLPSTAGVIGSIFKGEPVVLPRNVELQELLATLEFYGIPVNPKEISLEEVDRSVRLRANAFLACLASSSSARAFILSEFESAPESSKCFVAKLDHHCTEQINRSSSEKIIPLRGESKFASDPHHQWAQNEYFRDKMVSEIEDDGLIAAWKRKYLAISGPESEFDNRFVEHATLWTLKVTVPDAEPIVKRRRTAN